MPAKDAPAAVLIAPAPRKGPNLVPERCRDEVPELRELEPGHVVACHWAERIRAGEIKPKERAPVVVEPPPEAVPVPPPT